MTFYCDQHAALDSFKAAMGAYLYAMEKNLDVEGIRVSSNGGDVALNDCRPVASLEGLRENIEDRLIVELLNGTFPRYQYNAEWYGDDNDTENYPSFGDIDERIGVMTEFASEDSTVSHLISILLKTSAEQGAKDTVSERHRYVCKALAWLEKNSKRIEQVSVQAEEAAYEIWSEFEDPEAIWDNEVIFGLPASVIEGLITTSRGNGKRKAKPAKGKGKGKA